MLVDPPPGRPLLRSLLAGDARLLLVELPSPRQALATGALDAVVRFQAAPPGGGGPPGDFTARIEFDGSKDRSSVAHERLAEILERHRAGLLEKRLLALGAGREALRPYAIELANEASPRDMGRFFLRLWVPLMVVMMVALGTLYPAVDTTAGERERSTFETLATLPTDGINVVLAKYLYVATLASLAGLLNLAAVLLSLGSVLAPLLRGREADFSFALEPAALPVILAGIVLLALFVSAGMMVPAAFARSFKEGQALATPLLLGIFVPAQLFNVPSIEFTPTLALVPVGNVVLMLRDAVSGSYRWPQIGITLAVEAACIAVALGLAARVLRDEGVASGAYLGRFGAFLRERLPRWRAGRP